MPLALVQPFIKAQQIKLKTQWQLWEKYPPCSAQPRVDVTHVLHYDESRDDELEQTLRQMWEQSISLNTRERCFKGGLSFIYSNLTGIMNKHPFGPHTQFFNTFGLLQPAFDHWIQMEPDMLPVRRDWLEAVARRVYENTPECADFWMLGSNPRCDAYYGDVASRQDHHINANAVYCLSLVEFLEYLTKVQVFYPRSLKDGLGFGTPSRQVASHSLAPGDSKKKPLQLDSERAYDHTMYRYRLEPENWAYIKGIAHKFQYTSLIENKCEDPHDAKSSAYLVHSKFPFFSPEEQLVRLGFLRLQLPPPTWDQRSVLVDLGLGSAHRVDEEICARWLVAASDEDSLWGWTVYQERVYSGVLRESTQRTCTRVLCPTCEDLLEPALPTLTLPLLALLTLFVKGYLVVVVCVYLVRWVLGFRRVKKGGIHTL